MSDYDFRAAARRFSAVPGDWMQSPTGEFVRYEDYVASVRKYGTHVDGCQWQVFPPGERDCSCGLHAIIGVPDFASDAFSESTKP